MTHTTDIAATAARVIASTERYESMKPPPLTFSGADEFWNVVGPEHRRLCIEAAPMLAAECLRLRALMEAASWGWPMRYRKPTTPARRESTMSSVVIDRAVLERVRDALIDTIGTPQTVARGQESAECAASLDDALSAPEPFERLEDGGVILQERIAAIRARWQHIWEGDSRFSSAGDVRFLLTHIERLRAVVELARSAPEPITTGEDYVDYCLFCQGRPASWHDDVITHAPDCHWLVLTQAALRALDGGAE